MKKEVKQFLGYILFAYGIGGLSFAGSASFCAASATAGFGGLAYNSLWALVLIILGSYLITLSK